MVHLNSDPSMARMPPFSATFTSTLEKRDKCSSNLRATETVNVKVESKIEQLQIVGNSSEYLETKVVIQLD